MNNIFYCSALIFAHSFKHLAANNGKISKLVEISTQQNKPTEQTLETVKYRACDCVSVCVADFMSVPQIRDEWCAGGEGALCNVSRAD